ncbi:cytoplasmic protein, partial [Bacillus paranthracis]|nr:cytoplasmic protein [Bacillus paranthracis]
MNNDAKGLTFLTLSLLFLWLVFDDFVGKKRLSKLAQMMTPDLSMPSPGEVAEKVVDGAKESVKETTKNTREAQKEADK